LGPKKSGAERDECDTGNNACRYPTICRRFFHAVDLARIAFWKKVFFREVLQK